MQLKGKTALVTGGARRIGAALCEALAAEGCRVVIHYNRSAHPAESLAARLRRNGAQAWTVAGDFQTGNHRTGNYRMPRSADHVVRQAVAVALKASAQRTRGGQGRAFSAGVGRHHRPDCLCGQRSAPTGIRTDDRRQMTDGQRMED